MLGRLLRIALILPLVLAALWLAAPVVSAQDAPAAEAEAPALDPALTNP